MNQDRLNHVAVMHVHQNVLDSVDQRLIAQKFVSLFQNARHGTMCLETFSVMLTAIGSGLKCSLLSTKYSLNHIYHNIILFLHGELSHLVLVI